MYMKLIIGLGNPGEQYEKTRHNIGFMVVEQFLKDLESVKHSTWSDSKKFKSDIAELEWVPERGDSEKIVLVKPKTYMNNSGMAIKLLINFYKVQLNDVWIIHDDVDLPLGTLRIRFGGGSAGHRGLESILELFPTGDFWRFRCGIGRPEGVVGEGVQDFVVAPFSHQEKSRVREVVHHTAKALETALEEGMDSAMNHYNTR